MEFAILDVETTGGYGTKNRITEIAVIIHNGIREIERYSTLVNPETFIPQRITELTGINNHMVKNAPLFKDVARKIWDLTEGRIFVAHNVSFDYGVIRNEFNQLGADFTRRKLCTVRLARKVLPGKDSYSLGKLCFSLGINLDNAHRALADTQVTVKLFEILLKTGGEKVLKSELRALNKETKIPPYLDEQVYNDLPNVCGVYRFYNKDESVIFVGASKEIKMQIGKQFKSVDGANKESELVMEVANISYDITVSELIAELEAAKYLEKYKPFFNKLKKPVSFNIGIKQYTDQNGYHRLVIDRKAKQSTDFFLKFSKQADAKIFLEELVRKGRLCTKMVGLENVDFECSQLYQGMCKGACVRDEDADSYNQRLKHTLQNKVYKGDSFLVKDVGRSIDEYSVVWIQNGEYKGCGFFNHDLTDLDEIKKRIPKVPVGLNVLGLIKSTVINSKLNVIPLESTVDKKVEDLFTLF